MWEFVSPRGLSTKDFMASSAKKKKYDSVSVRTFKRWSSSNDFWVETDAEDQISLIKFT